MRSRLLARELFLAALAALAGPSSAADLSSLDQLVQRNDTVALAREFRSGQYPASELIPWLRRQAEAGHALPQYELADRLKAERLHEALSWYAKGRLARLLDEEECNRAGKTNAAAVGWLLDLGYQDLDTLARKNEPVFSKGMQAALAAEAGERRVSAGWICGGEANILPRPEALAARAKVRERLVRRTEDIASRVALEAAPVNPDGFQVSTLPDDYLQPWPAAWLDNDRLLFISSRKGDGVERVRAWNLSSGEIALSEPQIPRFYNFCYFDGFIWYAYGDGPEVAIKVGPLGKEREVWRARVSTPDQPGSSSGPKPEFHPISCRPREVGELTDSRRRMNFGLPEHGVLTSSVTTAGERVTLYRAGSAEPVIFPFPWTGFHNPRFAPFLGAYYMSRSGFATREEPLTFVVLYPDGRYEETAIPYGPWSHGSTGFAPTRQGIFMWATAAAGAADGVGASGGYLVRGDRVLRVIAGWPGEPRVSPNGCRVSMSYSPPNRSRLRTLSVVDLCAKGS